MLLTVSSVRIPLFFTWQVFHRVFFHLAVVVRLHLHFGADLRFLGRFHHPCGDPCGDTLDVGCPRLRLWPISAPRIVQHVLRSC